MSSDEAIRAELAEIRAAIVAQHIVQFGEEDLKSPGGSSQTTAVSSTSSFPDSDEDGDESEAAVDELVVSYSDGATPLFSAIESKNWKTAREHISSEAAATWVARTPEHETLFAWNHWKRLPFHEALRHPTVELSFLHALLQAYPEALQARTFHGATGLHIACDSGAPPTIVAWLVALCPYHSTVTDHSGRTPLEVLEDTGVLYPSEQAMAVSLIEGASTMVDEQKSREQKRLDMVQEKHDSELRDLKQRHSEAMRGVEEDQAELTKEIDRMHDCLEDQAGMWRDKWQSAQDQIVSLKMESRRLQRELKRARGLRENNNTKAAAGRVLQRQTKVVNPQLHLVHAQLAEVAQSLVAMQEDLRCEIEGDLGTEVSNSQV